jgi:hypothetical protein
MGELVGALVVPRMEWLGKVTEEEILETVKVRSVLSTSYHRQTWSGLYGRVGPSEIAPFVASSRKSNN